MKSSFKILSFLLILIVFSSCKKETTLSEYKYTDKEYPVQCESANTDLIKEALYSFEEDIMNHFGKNANKNLSQAYSRTINLGTYGRLKYEEMVSPHTLEIFKILKENTNLWKTEGNTKTLNYNSDLIKCLAENISDKEIKTTFNSLLITNSMRVDLLGAELRRKSGFALKDRYLATYIALDYYYAKLFNIDFVKTKKTEVVKPDSKPAKK